MNAWNARSIAMTAGVALVAFVSPQAHAHFVLVSPESYSEQNALGDPQKSVPCGQADPGNAPVETGAISVFQAGSMVTIKINETIFHPGHYRVSLATDQGMLPPDPEVTAGATACGSTVISDNPTLPLLADGLLVHTSPFSGEQTMQVQLPDGMTCENCTLQISQFMSNHGLNNPGGCFYHHCATVSITADAPPDAGPPVDSGDGTGQVDAGSSATLDDSGGCGCRVQSHGGAGGGALLGGTLLGLLVLRRRRFA